MNGDNRGVIPVLGSILLVALVVVLAAVSAVFILNVEGSLGEPAPTAAFDTDEVSEETVSVAHEGGDPIARSNLNISGGTIDNAPETIAAGDTIEITPNNNSEQLRIIWEQDERTTSLSEFSAPVDDQTEDTDPDDELAVVTDTNATTTTPITNFDGDPSEAQYDELEAVNLSDPFTLAVEAPELAGEEMTNYAVTAYYDEFDEAPNDRLAGPSTPLSFDENGIAEVTIGSAGTDADVTTEIAVGSVGDDASLINTIEVPEATEQMAVETE
ncbi:type IV pilin [Salinarchaeum sp. IM2453]|uniref:type IV pilin n=1 Tax=Salinarchaeum sp. IM2453 TaxID=2862870 RepID=UPI001C83291E|nr:type IV pilin [Salinarchaeum sp. IM2453]QZA88531.1 type IV pilin [Salinarchaeum sp. IM2453]